jgi:hypothetical protein
MRCPFTVLLIIILAMGVAFGAEPPAKTKTKEEKPVEAVMVPVRKIEEVNAIIRRLQLEKDDLLIENMELKARLEFIMRQLAKEKRI